MLSIPSGMWVQGQESTVPTLAVAAIFLTALFGGAFFLLRDMMTYEEEPAPAETYRTGINQTEHSSRSPPSTPQSTNTTKSAPKRRSTHPAVSSIKGELNKTVSNEFLQALDRIPSSMNLTKLEALKAWKTLGKPPASKPFP